MKFGDQLKNESVPQWGPHNIDYNELKHLIKKHTIKDQSNAIAIPGHDDLALVEFEKSFYKELCFQHDRVDLFVQSKTGELNRRLAHSQKNILQITSAIAYEGLGGPTPRQLEKLEKYERLVNKCNKDIGNLERFIDTQRTAFHKILKKYKKWTGSSRLTQRFDDDKLSDPKSFTRRSLQSLYMQSNDANVAIRLVSPTTSPSDTPAHSLGKARARKQRERVRREQEAATIQQRGWNEYDDGSEAGEEEPYYITIQPSSESTFFDTLSTVYQKSGDKFRSWFAKMPSSSHDRETSPLLSEVNNHSTQQSTDDSRDGHSTISRTNVETPRPTSMTSNSSLSSSSSSTATIPQTGYSTYYATFPSPSDQTHLRKTLQLRRNITVASFLISFVLLAISSLMLLVGKHRLRMEVDIGVVVGVIASVLVAVMGVVEVVNRGERMVGLVEGWVVAGAFVGVGFWAGILLVGVMGNTAFWGK